MIQKNSSYGYRNISELGQKGVFVRAKDKLARIQNCVWEGNDNSVPDETIADTWLDLANYSIHGFIQLIQERTVDNV